MSRIFMYMLRAAVLLAALLIAACAASGGDSKPPDMAYGHDLCDHCGMVIDDPRYAAAIRFDDGQVRKFDDAGEMFAYHAEHPNQAVRAWFAHDYTTNEWLRAERAFFVVSQQVHTPMGTGVAVFAARRDADTFAKALTTDTQARVMTFDEVRAALAGHGDK
jgi:copper chaperone NosL